MFNSPPKAFFIAPVVVAMLAGRGLDHDRIRSHGVPTGAYSSNAGGKAVSGAVGFGLFGAALGQISRPFAVSLGFSILVGVFFGTYPAVRASRLSPIDCLRHE